MADHTAERPRVAKVAASCCGKEIVRFDLPSRTPELLAEDAVRHGWTRGDNDTWVCEQHPVGPELFPGAHGFRRFYLHVDEQARCALYCADCDGPEAQLQWRTPRIADPLLNLGEMAEMAFRHSQLHHAEAAG